MTEYLELDSARKWQFLQQYYEAASRFYKAEEDIVSDKEIEACIRRFKEKPHPQYRKQVELKNWKFRLDPDDEGVGKEYFAPGYQDDAWEAVTVPHSSHFIPEPVRFGKLDCNLVKTPALWQATYDAWYRTSFPLDALKEDETAYLSFESVNLTSTVWVDDNPVMLDHVGLFPYKVDVGDELHRRSNSQVDIAVRARNIVSNHPNLFYNSWQFAYRNPPFTSGEKSEDWEDQADAGIAGKALLSVVNNNHLEDVFIYTREIQAKTASVVCQVILRNATWERFDGSIRVEISAWLPEESRVVQTISQVVQTLPMNETQLDLAFNMDQPHLWNVDTPNLYLAHIILENPAGQPLDDLYETFGVRTIEMKGSSFYLNNQRFVPRGTHDVAVYHGESEIAPSDYIIVKDILLHKKLGATCSRWPSDKSQHYKRLAEYCDQLGFMLSWCGYMMIWTLPPELEMLAQRDVKTTVRGLRNCPSIIFWEMGDEPFMWEHDFRRIRWYQLVYDLVNAEDKTRPILPAGDYCRDLLDLINGQNKIEGNLAVARAKTLADFPVYDLKNAAWDIHHVPHGKPVLAVLDGIRDAFAGHKPTVLTEFGAYGLPEFGKVIDIYKKFRWAPNPLSGLNVEKYAKDFYGRLIGAEDWKETQAGQAIIVSEMVERMRSHPDAFAAYYQVCMFDAWTFYWGLVDAHGSPKLAYWVVQSCYSTLFVSGLHGNTILHGGDEIAVTVSNYAQNLQRAVLQMRLLDSNHSVLKEQFFDGLDIPGGVKLSEVARVPTSGLGPGLYSIEFELHNQAGDEVATSLELFFVEN